MSYILVVDDNQGIRRLFNEMLVEMGYQVVNTTCGEEALQQILLEKPRLVLLDVKMPGLGGLNTLRILSILDYKIPIIVMSAYTESASIRQAFSEGLITEYIEKPFDLKEVIIRIANLLEGNREGLALA
ncbi:MAG: response regulator [Firmicutes bacterium]|nr:response regulator [Bacillota bacterium]